MELDLKPTGLGRVHSALVRGPLPSLELEFEDGSAGVHELAPQVARNGWRLEPWFATQYDLERWLAGEDISRVRRLRWTRPRDGELLVEPIASVRCTHLAPPRIGASLARSQLHPWASRPPSRVQFDGAAWTRLTDEGAVLCAQPTLRVEWELPSGQHAWRIRGALTRGEGESSAVGATLRVVLRERVGQRELEQRLLESPRGRGELRRFRASGIFELAAPAVLELQVQRGGSSEGVGEHEQISSLGPRETVEPLEERPRGHKRAREQQR